MVPEENFNKDVPFDMAKETLKSIRKWIDKIAELSVGIYGGERIEPHELITLKHKMVRQLIVLSSPLLKDNLKEIETFFSKIILTSGDVRRGDTWVRDIPLYSTDADYSLDECVQGIEKALAKYFVPSFSEGERYYG